MKKFLYCILIPNIINCGYNYVNANDLIQFCDETNSGSDYTSNMENNNYITYYNYNNKPIYEHKFGDIEKIQLNQNNESYFMQFMKNRNSLNNYTFKNSSSKSKYEQRIPIQENTLEFINFMEVTNSHGKSNRKSVFVNEHECKHEFDKAIQTNDINTTNDLLNFFMETNSQGNIPLRPVPSHHECESNGINQQKPENAGDLMDFFRVTNSWGNSIIQENIQFDPVNEQKFEEEITQEESTANDLIKFFIETNSLDDGYTPNNSEIIQEYKPEEIISHQENTANDLIKFFIETNSLCDEYTTNNFELIREYKSEEIIPQKRNTANDLIKFYKLTNSCDDRKYSENNTNNNNQDNDQNDNNQSVLRSTCNNNIMNILQDVQLQNNESNTNNNNQNNNNQNVLRSIGNNTQNSDETSQRKVRLLGKKKILGKIKSSEKNNTIQSSQIQNDLKTGTIRIEDQLQKEKQLQEDTNNQLINNSLQNVPIRVSLQTELLRAEPTQKQDENQLSQINQLQLENINIQQVKDKLPQEKQVPSQIEDSKQEGNQNIPQAEDQLQQENQVPPQVEDLKQEENQNILQVEDKLSQENQVPSQVENLKQEDTNNQLIHNSSNDVPTQDNFQIRSLRAINPLQQIVETSVAVPQSTTSDTVASNNGMLQTNSNHNTSSGVKPNINDSGNNKNKYNKNINQNNIFPNIQYDQYNSDDLNNKQDECGLENNNQSGKNNQYINNDSARNYNNIKNNPSNNDNILPHNTFYWRGNDFTQNETDNISMLQNNSVEILTNNVSDITMKSGVIGCYSNSNKFNYNIDDNIKTICISLVQDMIRESINKKHVPANISKLIINKVINKVISELTGKNINEIDKRTIERITKRIFKKISQEFINKMNNEIKSEIDKISELKNTTLNRIKNKEINETEGQKIIDDALNQILNQIPAIKQFQDAILEVVNELQGEMQLLQNKNNNKEIKNNISNINYENFTPIRTR